MQLADFEAMSFDCYGTLIDWEAGLSAVLAPWARAHGLDLTGEQLLTEYSSVEAAVEADHAGRSLPGRPGPQHAAARRAGWAPRSPASKRRAWRVRYRTGPPFPTPATRWLP